MLKVIPRPLVAVVLAVFLCLTAAILLRFGLAAGLRPLLFVIGAPAVASTLYLVWQLDPAYTLSAAVFLSPLSGNWQALGLPSGVNPDRLLLTLGILQVVLRAPAMRDRPAFRLTLAHTLLALAAAYVVASAWFAGTLLSKGSFFRIVDAFGILPFLTFLTAPLAFRTKQQRAVLLLTLVTLGGYLGLTTLFETIHLNALVFPKYILNPNYGIHYGRGRGPFVDAVANGFAQFVCAAACGIAVATWRQMRTRILAASIGILCLVGTFLSLERSVWIGATVGAAITMVTTRRARPYLAPVAAVVALGVIAALTLIPGLSPNVSRRLGEPTYDRQNLAAAGIRMIEARPLTGFGWGRFQTDSLLYFHQNQNYPLTDENRYGLHNFLLTYAVELGLPGAALWLLGVLAGIGSAMLTRGPPELRQWRLAVLAVFVMFVVVSDSVPPIEFPNLSLWLLAGVAFSSRYADSLTPLLQSAPDRNGGSTLASPREDAGGSAEMLRR